MTYRFGMSPDEYNREIDAQVEECRNRKPRSADTMNLTAGPELDAAVAIAVGDASVAHNWEDQGSNHYGTAYLCLKCGEVELTDSIEYDGRGKCIRPYSTDLNAAFEAAEKCGLFKFETAVAKGWLTLAGVGDADQNPAKQWGFMQFGYEIQRCWWMFPDNKGGMIGIAQPTPAMAICAAILALTARPSSSGSPSS